MCSYLMYQILNILVGDVLQTLNLEPLTNFECSYNKKSKNEDCVLNGRSRLLSGDGGIWANNQKIIQEELSLSGP